MKRKSYPISELPTGEIMYIGEEAERIIQIMPVPYPMSAYMIEFGTGEVLEDSVVGLALVEYYSDEYDGIETFRMVRPLINVNEMFFRVGDAHIYKEVGPVGSEEIIERLSNEAMRKTAKAEKINGGI